MQLIQSIDDLQTIRSNNPGKKIGTFKFNCNKVSSTEINFTDAHRACIQALRDATCEIVVLEFVNSHSLYSSLNLDPDPFPEPEIVDQTAVLNMCIADSIDADYILYNDPCTIDATTVTSVDALLTTEDYKNKLSIPDRLYQILRVNLQFLMQRYDVHADVLVRSYKLGTEMLAFDHFTNKYYTNGTILPLEPTYHPGTKIPISASTDIGDISDETKDFANYFFSVEKSAFSDVAAVESDLQSYADGLGGYSIKDFIVIDDPEFVGAGGIFASVAFNGPYGSTFLSNRYL